MSFGLLQGACGAQLLGYTHVNRTWWLGGTASQTIYPVAEKDDLAADEADKHR
jgi:hypothetical protein